MSVRVISGDARAVLATLPAASVQCCVTSPPYFGLRDYGTATWSGGDPAHEHDRVGARNGRGGSGAPGKQTVGAFPSTVPAAICSCGAVRSDAQMGAEPTLADYIAGMVAVMREVRRVLRDDGTLWLNIGDSYSSGGRGGGMAGPSGEKQRSNMGALLGPKRTPGFKDKDLLMVPARLAIALQDDGWWLRSDVIWHKPNPMPESVTDRPTSSHEHIFLLTKAATYFFDADAVRENAEPRDLTDWATRRDAGEPMRRGDPSLSGHVTRTATLASEPGRNIRNVWTIATSPYAEAHFATFPPELAERCIKAGSRPGDTVLDPFGGAGTTGLVADRLGRDAVLIELNPTYAAMARGRIVDDMPLFASVGA